MKVLRQVNSRNQITLPPKVLKRARICAGDYIEIVGEEGRVVLRPTEISDKGLSDEDWDKLERLVKREIAAGAARDYDSVEKAKGHLRKLSE
jgi:bifunctional DNA-binding transcriptional regulator/antitoxin component of YhaV-PrlF toxin-antitoxin module